MEDPSPELKVKASLLYINNEIFKLIQSVTKSPTQETQNEVYKQIQKLDERLNEKQQLVMKIRDREMKKELMESINEAKTKVFNALDLLRESLKSGRIISNAQIATLNDMAFRALKHRANQKKLDDRAMKNQEFYKKNEEHIKHVISDMKFDKLREEHKELIDTIGNCPLSTLDVIECIENSDAMCLGLQIMRSEATISDPTKLVIKDVVPTFLSAESFLDSASFMLSRNPDAHGGMSHEEGKLAEGIGRENISGVLPLYLFKEHWQVARKRAQPVYGFMCTADVMGYAASQFLTIPYLVLNACIKKYEQEPTDMNKRILDIVEHTCIMIILTSKDFENQIKETVADFLKAPMNRLSDTIQSLAVLNAQLHCLVKAKVEDWSIDTYTLKDYFKLNSEETMRRQMKNEEALNRQ